MPIFRFITPLQNLWIPFGGIFGRKFPERMVFGGEKTAYTAKIVLSKL
jgi:hypothetical protein